MQKRLYQIASKTESRKIAEFLSKNGILLYGDKVEVLAPSVLRQRIAQIAENMLRVNK